MSYDLRVWEHLGAVPASFEAAAQVLLALERLRPGPNPKFVALGKQMAARFPLYDRAQGRPQPEAVWMSDPGDDAKTCDAAVWAFEMPPDEREQVLRFVVDSANALGLIVFDDQLGIAFLPSGAVLPPERAGIWAGALREMDAEAAQAAAEQAAQARIASDHRVVLGRASAAVEPGLASLLQRHGFDAATRQLADEWTATFVRPAENGQQHIEITAYFTRYDTFSWQMTFRSRMDDVHAVLQECLPADRLGSGTGDLVFHPHMLDKSWLRMDLSAANEADIARLLTWIEAHAVPVLDRARSRAGARRLMNDLTPRDLPTGAGEPTCFADLFQSYGFAPLVSAWLHDRPSFERIAAAYVEPGFRVTRYWSQAELDAVIEHLNRSQQAANSS